MAKSLLDSLEDLKSLIGELATLNESQRQEIDALKTENQALRADLESTKAELQKAESDKEFLSMSWRLASDPDSLIESRRHIARLIRSLDLSIAMLKEG